MGNISVRRGSALESNYTLGHFGDGPSSNIIFHEVKNLKLHQIAFWPETVKNVEINLEKSIGIAPIPEPNKSIIGAKVALMRIEPLKILILGSYTPLFKPEEAATLDLSHSRSHLQISGPDATKLLNSFLPIDLRERSFPQGTILSTAFHHVGVTLWHTKVGYELFLPRGFALSLWELLLDGAAQYGYDVT